MPIRVFGLALPLLFSLCSGCNYYVKVAPASTPSASPGTHYFIDLGPKGDVNYIPLDDHVFKMTHLPNGMNIKLIGVAKIICAEGPPQAMLRYRTDIPVDQNHIGRIIKEETAIWPTFRINVEQMGLNYAAICACSPPRNLPNRPFVSYVSVWRKQGGRWVFQTK